MTTVIASIAAAALAPTRLEGNVSVDKKDGRVTISYKEKGLVKEKNKTFLASDLVAYKAGEAGFVVAMLNEPVSKTVGELIVKDGVQYIKTEDGTVVLNRFPGVLINVSEVDGDSKEARAAERAGKVKVRGAARRSREETSSKKTSSKSEKTSKADRIAARKAKAAKSSKEEAAPAKKKRRAA